MEAVLQGPFGRTVLGPHVITIGRASDNQLVVKDQTISSHHAEVRPGVHGYSLTDLGSTNGTFVNDRKLEQHMPHLLQGGDRIRIGGVKFMYEAGIPSLQDQLMQKDSFDDGPTEQLRASEYRAKGRGEQQVYQPPITHSNTPQQQPAPQSFTPALQQSNTPPWGNVETTSYGIPLLQQPYTPLPIQPSYTPLPVQSSYTPPLVQSPFIPLPMQPPYAPSPVQPKSSNRLKVLLIVLSVILVLGVAGGGIAAYFLTRPQPVMLINSVYMVASILAGSTGTVLHVNAHSFSGSSAITFLLDNVPVASNQKVNSDANGNVTQHLEGSFTNPNTISGTLSGDSITMDCNQGIGTQQANAKKGSWTAQM